VKQIPSVECILSSPFLTASVELYVVGNKIWYGMVWYGTVHGILLPFCRALGCMKLNIELN
jgi:hypothetical protein